ncbi:CopG family ribbon-helix-helix protein [Listeria aquatica]|uniref:CopG family transcriptional regulator n=1 Tax=Listeria aquatica TaxID=1494960 RepID=A0A841ZJK9_9LIST|nr:CopG family transcriptional regulator [Listeria aquatica]
MLEKKQQKEISISLTQDLLEELDLFVQKEKMERSEVIMEATQEFLKRKKAREVRVEMERGYIEMAKINFAIACECTHAESEAENRNIEILGG